jgi:hypothetical protein
MMLHHNANPLPDAPVQIPDVHKQDRSPEYTIKSAMASSADAARDTAAIDCFQAAMTSYKDTNPEVTGKWQYPAADPSIADWKPARLIVDDSSSPNDPSGGTTMDSSEITAQPI